MKAIVVEIREGFAAVLSDDGRITKIKNCNYEIGQVIVMRKQNFFKTKKFAACVATAAILIFGIGIGTYSYASPYSYVSLDVNPSIEFTLNRFDRVLNVKALNDDGEGVIKRIKLNNLENKTISQALTNTIEQIFEEGYFAIEEGGVIIATSSGNSEKSEKLAQELQKSVTTELEEKEVEVVEVESISVGYDRVQKANELGVTPGKLNLVEKLQASSQNPESINVEEWLNKPVKDIMKAIKENKKAAKVVNNEENGLDKDINTNENLTTDNTSADNTNNIDSKNSDIENTHSKDKEKEKIEKDQDKNISKQEKAKEKAEKTLEKANEKAEKTLDKANEKASKELEKVNEKTAKDLEKAKEKAAKDLEKANEKAAKELEKANEKAAKELEKANEKASKTLDKMNQSNKNSKNNDDDDNKNKNTFNIGINNKNNYEDDDDQGEDDDYDDNDQGEDDNDQGEDDDYDDNDQGEDDDDQGEDDNSKKYYNKKYKKSNGNEQ